MFAKLLTGLRQQSLGALALFVALGGTSYAVATGSIDSREIKNNSVRSADVRNGTLTGRDIARTTLQGLRGPVGPVGPSGAQGPKGDRGLEGPAGPVEAELFSGQHAASGGGERQLFAVPGLGIVSHHAAGLPGGRVCFVYFTNTSGQDVHVSGVRLSSFAAPGSSAQVVANGDTFTLNGVSGGPASGFSHVQAIRADATKVLELTSSTQVRPDATCVGAAQGTLND